MKALAASNIGQYEQSVHALGDYSRTVELGLGVCFRSLSMAAPDRRPITRPRARTVRAIVFGSDQGLVGQFNDVVAAFAVKALATLPGEHRVWAVGDRVRAQLGDAGVTVAGSFAVPSSVQAITALVGEMLVQSAAHEEDGEADDLRLYYNHPTTAAGYAPASLRVLPLDDAWRRRLADRPWPTKSLPDVIGLLSVTLRALVREYLFVSLFRACAESLASENASRLAAMQRADKNIDALLVNLHGTFHRLRQREIDEELFDVIAGFEALAKERENPAAATLI
jgi:F-type H+-transporting ATPase subunit gamma